MSWFKNLFKKSNNTTNDPVVSIPQKLPLPEIPTAQDISILFQINPLAMKELARNCDIIKFHIAKYLHVESKTGVPWDVVASCHYREAALDFNTCLHNGDPLPGPTTHVPKGRGPFNSWEEAAVDSFIDEKHNFPKVWDLDGKLAFCESYNGLGYKKRGLLSPYVWASTNKYRSGLYVADGKFDANKVDQRLGCAAIIKGLSIS